MSSTMLKLFPRAVLFGSLMVAAAYPTSAAAGDRHERRDRDDKKEKKEEGRNDKDPVVVTSTVGKGTTVKPVEDGKGFDQRR